MHTLSTYYSYTAHSYYVGSTGFYTFITIVVLLFFLEQQSLEDMMILPASTKTKDAIDISAMKLKRGDSSGSIASTASSSSLSLSSEPSQSTASSESPCSLGGESTLSWSRAILSWIPSAVHYLVLCAPLLLAVVIRMTFSWLSLPDVAFYVYIAGALCRFTCASLFHGDNLLKRPITTRHAKCPKKKNVAVIGAGPSGLAAAKELLEAGHEVTVYESAPKVGGEFAHRFYPGGRLTSSPYTTAFSDFEPERVTHYTKDEYARYLREYGDRFVVTPNVKLNTRVSDVSGKAGSFFVTSSSVKDGSATRDGPFDHVAVCTGQNQAPSTNEKKLWNGTFDGRVLHTSDFWRADRDDPDVGFEALAGRRVVTIGLGEAMADILGIVTSQMTKPPVAICSSVRRGAFVVPRTNPLTGMNNDFDSTRLRYALPKMLNNWSMDFCAKVTRRFGNITCPRREVRHDLLERLGGMPAYVRATKSDEFVDAVVSGDVKLKPAIEGVDGSTVYFADGTTMESVDVILCGTGYDFGGTSFPFLDGLRSNSSDSPPASRPVDRLFRMFDPAYGDGVSFVGMGVRPILGSIPTSAEMQARLLALVVGGERRLPDPKAMQRMVEQDRERSMRDLGPYNEGWTGLVNWIPFMDSVANEVGCLPKWHWCITRPTLWLALLTGPMTTFHYRLTGPGSGYGKADLAEGIVRKLPGGSRGRDLAFYAALHLCLSILGWPAHAARLCRRAADLALSRACSYWRRPKRC